MPETIVLPGLPSMVPVARHAVHLILEDCPRRSDAELIVSELASNVVLHSRSGCEGGQFRVLVDLKPGWARVEVSDDGPLPAGERAGERGEFGRGLVVVDAFADRWGHQRTETCATYWAELDWEDPDV